MHDMDMSYEQQKRWEEQELDKEVDFDNCKIGTKFTIALLASYQYRVQCYVALHF